MSYIEKTTSFELSEMVKWYTTSEANAPLLTDVVQQDQLDQWSQGTTLRRKRSRRNRNRERLNTKLLDTIHRNDGDEVITTCRG